MAYKNLEIKKLLPEDYQEVETKSRKYRVRTIEDLTPRQRKFCDNILEGKTITDSYFEAGYFPKANREDPKTRRNAYANAYDLMQVPIVHNYLVMNTPQEPELVVSEDSMIERLFLIFNGQTEIKTISKKGETYYTPPSFKDQIMAAQTLLQIIKMKESKAPVDTRVSLISKRMSELTKDIRKTALIDDGLVNDKN